MLSFSTRVAEKRKLRPFAISSQGCRLIPLCKDHTEVTDRFFHTFCRLSKSGFVCVLCFLEAVFGL